MILRCTLRLKTPTRPWLMRVGTPCPPTICAGAFAFSCSNKAQRYKSDSIGEPCPPHGHRSPRASLERMGTCLTLLEAGAFVEEGIELVFPLPIERAGHIAAVIDPSPSCPGECAGFRGGVSCR